MVPINLAAGVVGERETQALFGKAIKREQDRKTSERLDERSKQAVQQGLQEGNKKFNPEEIVVESENIILTKVFPVFLIIIGAFIIIISIAVKSESMVPLYLGIFITVLAVVWDITSVIKRRNERKINLLRGRLD